MTANDTLKTIASTLAKGHALSDSVLDRFADYAVAGDAIVAFTAFTVSRLGTIANPDGAESLTAFAARVDVKRSALSQRVTAVSWIVDAKVDVDAETFAVARTLYGRGKSVRDALPDVIAKIASEPKMGVRRAAWLGLRESLKATEAAATTGDDSTGTAGEPGDGTTEASTMTREDWIGALDALAATAVLLSDASDAERAHVQDTLAAIAARVEVATANTGSGRA